MEYARSCRSRGAHLVIVVLLLALLAPLDSGAAPAASPERIYLEPNGWSLRAAPRTWQPGPASALGLTIGFCPDYDVAYRAYAQDWFAAVYPAIVTMLGEPLESDHVCLCPPDYAGWPPGCDQLIVGGYPRILLPYEPGQETDGSWEHAMTHEFIHAHHSYATPSYCEGSTCYADWVEEGLTEAGAELVVEYARAAGIRDMRIWHYRPEELLLEYDVANLAGTDFWGGAPVPSTKYAAIEAYRMSSALFWIVGTSQQGTAGDVAAGDWIQYDWFRRLHERLYAWRRANPYGVTPLATFYQIVDGLSPLPIDGQRASAWMQAQPITHHGNPGGHYMGVLPTESFGTRFYAAIDPTEISIAFFTLDAAPPYEEHGYYGEVNGSYAIYDSQDNQVRSGTFLTSDVEISNPCEPGDGVYRVVVQADIEGTQRTAHTAYMCTGGASREDGLEAGLILMEEDGTLFDGTATSRSGSLGFNVRGGAVLRPYDVSQLPKTVGVGFAPAVPGGTTPPAGAHTVYLPAVMRHWPPPDVLFYNLPLPFSRVVVATRPQE